MRLRVHADPGLLLYFPAVLTTLVLGRPDLPRRVSEPLEELLRAVLGVSWQQHGSKTGGRSSSGG